MKNRITYILAVVLTAALTIGLTSPAAAACFADYKAKRDDPLRLHYGVIELPDVACSSKSAASSEIKTRLAKAGWQVLNVLSIFEQNGLESRKESAGDFYLRY